MAKLSESNFQSFDDVPKACNNLKSVIQEKQLNIRTLSYDDFCGSDVFNNSKAMLMFRLRL